MLYRFGCLNVMARELRPCCCIASVSAWNGPSVSAIVDEISPSNCCACSVVVPDVPQGCAVQP